MFKFDINLKDPASIYAFHLINLHHKIIWFLILVLAVVYWSFYKTIRDYNWNNFNRQAGIFRISYNFSFFIYLEVIFHFIISWFLFKFYYMVTYLLNLCLNLFISTPDLIEFLDGYEVLDDDKDARVHPYHHSMFVIGQFAPIIYEFLVLYYISSGCNKIDLLHLVNTNKSILFDSSSYNANTVDLWNGIMEIIRYKYFHYLVYGLPASQAYFNTNLVFLYNSNYSSIEETTSDLLINLPFNERKSLEYIWTFFPSVVIYLILVPSLYLLYSLDDDIEPIFLIKVIGHQWFWSYEFDLDYLNASYEIDSSLISESDLELGAKRLLEVDNRLYLPVNIPFKLLITSTDVLHSWSVPELGIKVDAVPGRLNETLTCITRPGIFYGQCSELCGVGHGFMPIVIEAVSFNCWVEKIDSFKV